jgi:Sulfotransferase domain
MPTPVPTFLIIGAQKSGTRWLRHNLGRHRSVFTADHEVEYFNHNYDRGVAWYSDQFDGWRGEPAVGEATPGYLMHVDDPSVVASRIEDTLGGQVALIALLRDPVDRARSSYLHHLRRGRIDPDADPAEYLSTLDPETDPLGVISGGWYGRSLDVFARRFDRLHVEFHADIAQDAESLFVRILERIGIDDPWVPEGLQNVRFSGVKAVEKQFPNHPILTISDEEIRRAIGEALDADTELLERVVGRRVPWTAAA